MIPSFERFGWLVQWTTRMARIASGTWYINVI